MKKSLLVFTTFLLTLVVLGQEATEPKLKIQGGLWTGTNGRTSIVGVPAAKLSIMFTVSKKTKVETGLMLVPGLISDEAGERLGLSAGGTVTIRKDGWKLKPVVGLVLVKTDTWEAMPGIGFVF